MTTPLFSTYRKGENRVTASFLAVLERLSLPTWTGFSRTSSGSVTPVSLFSRTSRRVMIQDLNATRSRPDLLSGCETKTARNAVRVNQIKDHLKVVCC